MNIAIIAAMDKEMRLLLPLLEAPSKITVNGVVFHTGKIGSHKAVVCKCGIGKVNAAIGALSLIDTFHPDMVINSGIAGGTGKAGILEVVVADSVAYHDVWCGEGTALGQADGCPQFFECALSEDVRARIPGTRGGLVVSGDAFITDAADVERILKIYPDAVAVEMESAAIAHVCHLKNVPFVCIRVISDTPGCEDHLSQYANFWEDAPEHTFAAVKALLEAI